MEKTNTGGLQYGIREILMFVFAVAYVIGLTKWMWMKDIFELSLFIGPLVFISGCSFFLIGRSMRARTPLRNLNRITCSAVLAVMVLLILLFSYCVWASDHLQSDLAPSKVDYILTKGFPHGWPYPDQAFPWLCNLDITTPRPRIYISWEALRQLEYTIKSTYAPLFAGICLCLGVLMPAKNRTKEEAIRRIIDESSAAAHVVGPSANQPSVGAPRADDSTPRTSPPPRDRNN
jgi:hypothetical protein